MSNSYKFRQVLAWTNSGSLINEYRVPDKMDAVILQSAEVNTKLAYNHVFFLLLLLIKGFFPHYMLHTTQKDNRIKLFQTTLRTPNEKLHYIQNATLFTFH